MKKISELLRAAKDGLGGRTMFLCHAVDYVQDADETLRKDARDFIQSKLEGSFTYEGYLVRKGIYTDDTKFYEPYMSHEERLELKRNWTSELIAELEAKGE